MSHDYKTRDILDQRLIQIYMQAILSHHEAFEMGIEAFVKGIHPITGDSIGPYTLFENAKKEGLDFELSMLTMKMAMEVFQPMHSSKPESLLYLNIHESVIQAGDDESLIGPLLEAYKLSPKNIVFDIGDYENVTFEEIQKFIDQYRALGYYISIDDIGKNYFNLDRIILFNPDIIKINHQYLAKLNNEAYTVRVLKHVGDIAHEMGMVVVDTGIENEAELKKAFDQGAQYFQGYYIQEPRYVTVEDYTDFFECQDSEKLLLKYAKVAAVDDMRLFMNKVVQFLGKLKEDSLQWETVDGGISSLFSSKASIENGWLLDGKGIQSSEAIINNVGFSKRNADIFKMTDVGYDYSNEDLYRFISSGTLDVWITKPYISLLTNNTCVTTSSYLLIEGKEPIILCLVFDCELFKKEVLV